MVVGEAVGVAPAVAAGAAAVVVVDADEVRAPPASRHDAKSGFLLCPIIKGDNIRTHVQ